MPLSMPFQRGQLVVLVLHTPRERLWGRLLGLEESGIALRGFELTPWEDVLACVKNGDPQHVALNTRFVPLHRVENVYVDEPSSGARSLAQEFEDRTGVDPQTFLADPLDKRRKR